MRLMKLSVNNRAICQHNRLLLKQNVNKHCQCFYRISNSIWRKNKIKIQTYLQKLLLLLGLYWICRREIYLLKLLLQWMFVLSSFSNMTEKRIRKTLFQKTKHVLFSESSPQCYIFYCLPLENAKIFSRVKTIILIISNPCYKNMQWHRRRNTVKVHF